MFVYLMYFATITQKAEEELSNEFLGRKCSVWGFYEVDEIESAEKKKKKKKLSIGGHASSTC